MEIEELNEITDHVIKRAADNYEITAGKNLKIRVAGNLVLDTEVPEGKIWVLNIIAHIVERDE